MKKQYLEAGRIVNTHGVRGEVRIEPWADDAAFLTRFRRFFIHGRPIGVVSCRVHKTMCIASFEGIDDINQAMALKGAVICIDRGDVTLPEGTVFLQDILGARVVTEDGHDLGVLTEVLPAPAASVYVVRGEREILIPDVDEFILCKDADNAVVTVRLIDGM